MLKLIAPLILWVLISFPLNLKSEKINFVNKSLTLSDTASYKDIYGTWVHHDSSSFTLIEVKDTSNVHVAYYCHSEMSLNTLTKTPFTFIELNGILTFINDSIFKIDFSDSWIWYKIKGDTLFEFGAMREDAMLFKMPNNDKMIKPLQ